MILTRQRGNRLNSVDNWFLPTIFRAPSSVSRFAYMVVCRQTSLATNSAGILILEGIEAEDLNRLLRNLCFPLKTWMNFPHYLT